jgi:L-ascorbate metabolism protein UlaG (beta-lactamase superfamily)
MIWVFLFLLLAGCGMFLLLRQPPFGALPTGKRLARIRESAFFKRGAFQNPEPTAVMVSRKAFFSTMREYATADKKVGEPQQPIPAQPWKSEYLHSQEPILVWFGHSSYFLRLDGCSILVDPVFSGYASPFAFGTKNFAGTNIYHASDFPSLDVILITHDHFDHLDYKTIRTLASVTKRFVTSLGVGAHLERWGVPPEAITELGWWEQTNIATLTFTATPARHFSGRTLKRYQSHWSGFAVQSSQAKLFLGGDSGYGAHFREIGERLGPFDVALLECGQYNPAWKFIHMMPEQTVRASRDLGARVLFPIHWGKFRLALHGWKEPIERAIAAAADQQVVVTAPHIGQPIYLQKEFPLTFWWRQVP